MSFQLSAFSFQLCGPPVLGGRHGKRPLRAFSLVELMVVVGIIALLLAVAVPAMGPLLKSNGQAQMMNTLNGLATTAQVYAESLSTPVGIRIEQAYTVKQVGNSSLYKNVKYPAMRDVTNTNDRVDYLPNQQARLVKFSDQRITDRDNPPTTAFQPAFEQLPDTRVTPLPKASWIAPIESIERDGSGAPIKDGLPTSPQQAWILEDQYLTYQPVDCPLIKTGYIPPSSQIPVSFNRLDTFYIVFDRFGGVRRFPDGPKDHSSLLTSPGGGPKTHFWYRDTNQPYPDPTNTANAPIYSLIDHPDASARGVLIYDREQWETVPNVDADRRNFLQKAKPVYLGRSIGEVVEGRQ